MWDAFEVYDNPEKYGFTNVNDEKKNDTIIVFYYLTSINIYNKLYHNGVFEDEGISILIDGYFDLDEKTLERRRNKI